MSNTEYQVFARRFRPTCFDEVIGQDHVSETLKNAVNSLRVAQAYLFSGPRGVGKTSIARIFSKSLNCTQGPTLKPCGECVSCTSIALGDDTDVIEIDGASNRGIDEIRDLREKVRFAPGHGRYKIYIIDEVHMLTDQAFNALLKTLEEPPAHVIFIFATTRPEKLPDTITSRCQRYTFNRIPTALIKTKLEGIAKTEKIEITPEAMGLIARRAAGSLRDGESLFDQVVAFSGDKIEAVDVERSLGLVAVESVEKLVVSVLNGDAAKALKAIDKLSNEGADMVQTSHQAIDYLRNLMVLNTAPHSEELVELSAEELKKMRNIAQSLHGSTILSTIDIFLEATGWMSRVLSPRLLLEFSAIKAAQIRQIMPIEEFIAAIKDPENAAKLLAQTKPTHIQIESGAQQQTATESLLTEPSEIQPAESKTEPVKIPEAKNSESATQPAEPKPEPAESKTEPVKIHEAKNSKPVTQPAETKPESAVEPIDSVKTSEVTPTKPITETATIEPELNNPDMFELWDGLVSSLTGKNASLAGMLSHGKPVEFIGDILAVSFPAVSELIVGKLREDKRKNILNEILRELTGRNISIQFSTEKPVAKTETTEKTVGQPVAPQTSKPDGGGLFNEPEMKTAQDMFGGDFIGATDVEDEEKS